MLKENSDVLKNIKTAGFEEVLSDAENIERPRMDLCIDYNWSKIYFAICKKLRKNEKITKSNGNKWNSVWKNRWKKIDAAQKFIVQPK